MNRKHKNKNKHGKPPNPVPPQIQDVVVEEKVDSDVKAEERVPEIISDAILLQDVVEVKQEQEVGIPKKPKRSRGDKKKIQEKLEVEENNTVKIDDTELKLQIECKSDASDLSKKEEMILKNTEIVTQEQTETVVPSSRKKKGKNKKSIESLPNKAAIAVAELINTMSEDINSGGLDSKTLLDVKDFEAQNLDNTMQCPLKEVQSEEPEFIVSKKKSKNKKSKKNIEELNTESIKAVDVNTSKVEITSNPTTTTKDIGSLMDKNLAENIQIDSAQEQSSSSELKAKLEHVDTSQEKSIDVAIERDPLAANIKDKQIKDDNPKNKKKNKKNKSEFTDLNKQAREPIHEINKDIKLDVHSETTEKNTNESYTSKLVLKQSEKIDLPNVSQTILKETIETTETSKETKKKKKTDKKHQVSDNVDDKTTSSLPPIIDDMEIKGYISDNIDKDIDSMELSSWEILPSQEIKSNISDDSKSLLEILGASITKAKTDNDDGDNKAMSLDVKNSTQSEIKDDIYKEDKKVDDAASEIGQCTDIQSTLIDDNKSPVLTAKGSSHHISKADQKQKVTEKEAETADRTYPTKASSKELKHLESDKIIEDVSKEKETKTDDVKQTSVIVLPVQDIQTLFQDDQKSAPIMAQDSNKDDINKQLSIKECTVPAMPTNKKTDKKECLQIMKYEEVRDSESNNPALAVSISNLDNQPLVSDSTVTVLSPTERSCLSKKKTKMSKKHPTFEEQKKTLEHSLQTTEEENIKDMSDRGHSSQPDIDTIIIPEPSVSNIDENPIEKNTEFKEGNIDIHLASEIKSEELHQQEQQDSGESTKDKSKMKIDIVPKGNISKTTSEIQSILPLEMSFVSYPAILSSKEGTPHSVQYPRSNSEQTFDDNNNNVVITEIGPSEMQKLIVPVVIPETPFIDGPKEHTVIGFPTETKISEDLVAPYPIIPEKTSLKSKVIEVNQDMEELRLSIEKSLAELTAIEKSEQITELMSIKTPAEQIISPEGDLASVPFTDKLTIQTGTIDIVSKNTSSEENLQVDTIIDNTIENVVQFDAASLPFSKKDQKCKGKSKNNKKNNRESQSSSQSLQSTSNVESSSSSQATEKETKSNESKEKSNKQESHSKSDDAKKQNDGIENNEYSSDSHLKEDNSTDNQTVRADFDIIEHFEDAMTSSIDDINRSFELIATEATASQNVESTPENVNIQTTEMKIEEKHEKQNPIVSHPKNLLGLPVIPVASSRTDYKKEKNKPPNTKHAKVKLKGIPEIETLEKTPKQSKQSQTEHKPKALAANIVKTYDPYENEEYTYKYSFRKVYLPHCCHVCKKELKDSRVSCRFCNLMFYCSEKHRDEDWTQHQSLCFAVSTIVHLKGSKYIYADAKDITGHSYRLLRMQTIVSCENILKRRLIPMEQEALLYPRMCVYPSCREWQQENLKDCEGCGQIFYCMDKPDHFPKSHLRWCRSYSLYQKMVVYQQTRGRLEPRLPTKVISDLTFEMPEKINELLATLYEERIDMDDLQYAALTQVATAPLTAAYCHQVYTNKMNSTYANGVFKKPSFTLHVIGAELQFEADALHKWETFFLHLRPDIKELRVVLVGAELNPSNLPLEILAKNKMCEHCRLNERRVVFNFYDKELYHQFAATDEFTFPDIICAFNSGLNHAIGLSDKDKWTATVDAILKLRAPCCLTSYTPDELPRDLNRIRECASKDFKIISEADHNPYSSVRPDRNFITDDEMPLLFKNYYYMIICG